MPNLDPIGPLTDAAFPRDNAEGPPPIVQEWIDYHRKHGGRTLIWAGTEVREGGRHDFSWSWMHQSTQDEVARHRIALQTACRSRRLAFVECRTDEPPHVPMNRLLLALHAERR